MLTVTKERDVLLSEGSRIRMESFDVDVIMTQLSPSCSIEEWKKAIGKRLNIDPTSFTLVSRMKRIEEQHTIRHYGITPEIMIYIDYHK